MTSIASIARACGTVVGGLRHLQIIAVEDVANIPDAINSIVQSEISLVSGAEVAVIEFPPSGGDFTESPKDADSGTIITSKFKIDIPKDAPELGHWANANHEKEVIALYVDENNVAVIVGDLDRPLIMKMSRSSGRRGGDKNFYEMALEAVSSHYSYYYMMFEKKSAGNRKVYTAGYTFGFQRT